MIFSPNRFLKFYYLLWTLAFLNEEVGKPVTVVMELVLQECCNEVHAVRLSLLVVSAFVLGERTVVGMWSVEFAQRPEAQVGTKVSGVKR